MFLISTAQKRRESIASHVTTSHYVSATLRIDGGWSAEMNFRLVLSAPYRRFESAQRQRR